MIILETVRRIGEAGTVANNVRRALARPISIHEHEMNVTVSIGVSFYPENGEDADTLLRAADYAMYLAKREGGNRHLTCLPGLPRPGEVLEKR